MTLSECANFLHHPNPTVRRDGAKGLRKFKSGAAFLVAEMALNTEQDKLVRESIENSLLIMTKRRDRSKALKSIPVLLAALCLSGCLTASKLLKWETALYGWALSDKASQDCRDKAATASKYLTDQNTNMNHNTRTVTDLRLDTTARALMTAAAKACGRSMP